jgi:glycosyltransferase involved in cell wall biosynthesis
MRVGVDGRALRASRAPRGVAVYLEELLRELVRLHPDDEYVVLVPGGARAGAVPAGAETMAPRGSRLHAAGAILGRPRLDRMLRRPDVVWLPAIAPVAISGDAPYVVTVHDLSFVHQPSDFTAYERLWHRVARPRRLVRGATRVITDTEHVRREAIAEWGIAEEGVTAVHPGPGRARAAARAGEGSAGEGAATEGAAGAAREGAYVLAVGALEARKLPLVLVRAHSVATERGLRAPLVFAGDGPLRAEVEAAGARVLAQVADEELGAAYGGALCLACVSREEGFGFTPLEALAAGVPPVVSELPVFAETVGDAALRVPVGDVDALADALLRMEREPQLRVRLVEAGRARLRELSWERAARETRAVFEEAAR